MYTYEIATAGSVATLRFSTDADPDQIADAVRLVFDRYDSRFKFGAAQTGRERPSRVPTNQGTTSADMAEAMRFAQEWRLRLDRSRISSASVELTDFRSFVHAMAMGSASALLDEAGAADWSIALDGDYVTSAWNPSRDRRASRNINPDTHASL